MKKIQINNALISVYNKDGIFELSEFLRDKDINMIASDGTAEYLNQNGINVEKVSDFTEFPHLLGGRVKTLHPKIFSGILADRDNPEHTKDMEENDIHSIELVIVNLYPFTEKCGEMKEITELIELIDIGGVALLRAGAKNFRHCLVLSDPGDYNDFIAHYTENDGITPEYSARHAAKAFKYTSYYDCFIAGTLEKRNNCSDENIFSMPYILESKLRYGENPHQEAGLYRDRTYTGDSVFNYEQIQGKELSFNNILDIDMAIRINDYFREANCVIIKHNNPCGFCVGRAEINTFHKAWDSDPVSAFGSIIGFNYEVDKTLAEEIFKKFIEVIICRSISDEALEILGKKKNLRVLVKRNKELKMLESMDIRQIKGGVLIQDEDTKLEMNEDLKQVTKAKMKKDRMNDIFYGLKLIRFFKSNSILFIKDGQLLGAGFGQPNRVDCVRLGIEKAGEKIEDSIMVSDAFFPFRDSIDSVKDLKLAAVVQPGGSVKDEEVINACNEFEIPMYFTGIRHFRH